MSQSSNQLTGGEAVVRLLEAHGVDTVFGLCGDTSLPLYDAFYRIGGNIRHVLTRDERSAAYMADGYARVTGKVGVAEGPSGGGATYILPGVIEASESSIPILALTSDISVTGRGRYTLTEMDQGGLFKTLTKWNGMADTAASLPTLFRRAFREMTTGRPGAAHIGLPYDVLGQPVDAADVWGDPAVGVYPSRRMGPDPTAVDEAAALLTSAKFPVIVCGGGPVIAGAEAEVTMLGEALGAVVATTISGQGAISDSHRLALGVVGSNGGVVETREVLSRADVVLFIGCRAGSVTTERWRYPAPGAAKIVHIDSDPAVIGANYVTDVAVAGDAKLALTALISGLGAARDGGQAAEAVKAAKRSKFDRFNALAQSDETPIRPERLVAAMQRVAPKDATIVCDPGTPCPYFSAYYEFEETGRHFISNRAHGALGYSMAAGLGAHIGRPEVKTISIMGDGSFGFTAGEMETMVRLGAPITFIVVSNGVFGWIKAGQRHGYDERFFSTSFSRTDHAAVAEGFGVKAWRVEDPAELEGVLRAALEHDGPSLVDVVCQPLDEAAAPVSEWVA
ncbi:MAG: thiamine pyrophosphate-binding protein [Alphaproteobacteria bacterium]